MLCSQFVFLYFIVAKDKVRSVVCPYFYDYPIKQDYKTINVSSPGNIIVLYFC